MIAAAYHSHAFGASRKRSITQRHIRDATRAGNRPLKSGTVHESLIFSLLSLKTKKCLHPLIREQGNKVSAYQGTDLTYNILRYFGAIDIGIRISSRFTFFIRRYCRCICAVSRPKLSRQGKLSPGRTFKASQAARPYWSPKE